MNTEYSLAILTNEQPDDHRLWVQACRDFQEISFEVIDFTRNDWYQKVTENQYDFFLLKPPGVTAPFKQMYDERVYIINKILQLPIYPTYDEILIHENKRFLSYWLKANNIPHPETNIFYFENDALEFVSKTSYPLVAKINIGASGSGVQIIRNSREAQQYIRCSFSAKGASRRWGPNLAKGNKLKRGLHYVAYPGDISKKIKTYQTQIRDVQKDFVIFQEYIPHDFEWRVVAIGDSYFAHKKVKKGEKASGTLLKEYVDPPKDLLDFLRNIMNKCGFCSQAVDIFQTVDRGYLVNEMQCMFGQADPYQMLVGGKPGRYRFLQNGWIFEEGMFNTNQSFDLRLKHVLEILNSINI